MWLQYANSTQFPSQSAASNSALEARRDSLGGPQYCELCLQMSPRLERHFVPNSRSFDHSFTAGQTKSCSTWHELSLTVELLQIPQGWCACTCARSARNTCPSVARTCRTQWSTYWGAHLRPHHCQMLGLTAPQSAWRQICWDHLSLRPRVSLASKSGSLCFFTLHSLTFQNIIHTVLKLKIYSSNLLILNLLCISFQLSTVIS